MIPTRNDERVLVPTLSALVPGAAEGLVRDVTIADAGSTDATREIADLAGCALISGLDHRADRLDAAARRARGPWILFLEPDAALDEGWHREVRSFIDAAERSGCAQRRAAVFRFGVDGFGVRVRAAERLAGFTAWLTGLPRLEQGLLIHKAFYETLGGFRPLPAMAEADLIRRIGRGRIVRLRTRALAPAARASEPEPGRAGPRAALGAGLLMLRVPPRLVARLYG